MRMALLSIISIFGVFSDWFLAMNDKLKKIILNECLTTRLLIIMGIHLVPSILSFARIGDWH